MNTNEPNMMYAADQIDSTASYLSYFDHAAQVPPPPVNQAAEYLTEHHFVYDRSYCSFIIDLPNHRIVRASDNTQPFTGYPRDHWEGASVHQLTRITHPDDHDVSMRQVMRAQQHIDQLNLQARRTARTSILKRHDLPTGEVRWIHGVSTPLYLDPVSKLPVYTLGHYAFAAAPPFSGRPECLLSYEAEGGRREHVWITD